ncbi:unnamed protein product, partial [marine sediment metagenome]
HADRLEKGSGHHVDGYVGCYAPGVSVGYPTASGIVFVSTFTSVAV